VASTEYTDIPLIFLGNITKLVVVFMKTAKGILIYFDESQRSDFLKEKGSEGYSFSDTLSVSDWTIKRFQVAILSFSGNTFDYICLAVKGKKVATAKYRVEFFDFVDLHSLPVSDVQQKISGNLQRHFINVSNGKGGSFPDQTWSESVTAIKALRPQTSEEINRIISIQQISSYQLTGLISEKLLQEREAFGAALDIFCGTNQLRKKVLSTWSPGIDKVEVTDESQNIAEISDASGRASSLLSGISEKYISEESAIQHDLYNWPEIERTSHEVGVSTFQQGHRMLEVVYANRNRLEETLGVDLIYHNLEFNSFILVQYKLMKEENKGKDYIYRPDPQFDKELSRMNDFTEHHSRTTNLVDDAQYRLLEDGFFFKLVPNIGFRVASPDLISGMYLTRAYVNYVVSPIGPRGPRGGKVFGFKNTPRYLTNSEFVNMVNRGWIGTMGNDSDVLCHLISGFLESGNAVLIATESRNSLANSENM